MLDRYADAARHVPGEVAEPLLEQGHRPPVLAGRNLDGRPAMRENAEVMRPYVNRVRAPRGELP